MKRLSVLAIAASLMAPHAWSGSSMTLDAHGGGLGQTLTLTIDGSAGDNYLLWMSLNTGPTPLPGHPVGSVNVGGELMSLAIGIPGFLGVLPGSGSLALPLPVPTLPVLDGFNINFQATKIVGNKLVAKSNLWRVTLENPGDSAHTLNPQVDPRAFGTATALEDGSVLIIGGGYGTLTGQIHGINWAERYLPNLEASVALPSMYWSRAGHTATLLNDGRVLVTGGLDANQAVQATAEVWDPNTGYFAQVQSMAFARGGHTANLLPDGRVFIAGGSNDASTETAFYTSSQSTTEIFNPVTNTFSPGPAMSTPRCFHTATTRQNGSVAVVGGLSYTLFLGQKLPEITRDSEVYTPGGGFGPVVQLAQGRAAHSAVLLDDGRVFIAGGIRGAIVLLSPSEKCELLNTSGTAFTAAADLNIARAYPTIVKLESGKVALFGGISGTLLAPTILGTSEVYTPNAGSGSFATPNNMVEARALATGALLSDGTVGIFGGGGVSSGTIIGLATSEIFQPE